ncbi:hypothetical protein [Tsukamurella asaccharolytica]|uniref:hypothetical protein n=1 Tax=Tsukamurella asaccharolytica TaxID=2592067 RepID=UPI00131585C0|nr:hypothetical protein [Tsukamurella asaccharolytica]
MEADHGDSGTAIYAGSVLVGILLAERTTTGQIVAEPVSGVLAAAKSMGYNLTVLTS